MFVTLIDLSQFSEHSGRCGDDADERLHNSRHGYNCILIHAILIHVITKPQKGTKLKREKKNKN